MSSINGLQTLPAIANSSSTAGTSGASEEQKEASILSASILSVYDLPFAEPPSSVSMSLCGQVVRSGPPISRHKDKNSFRFSVNGSTNDNVDNNSLVKLSAPLRELYKSKLTICWAICSAQQRLNIIDNWIVFTNPWIAKNGA